MFKCTNTKTKNTRGTALQRGSALIIALVFLLIMTLIGTTAMQGTGQQEKMAGNMQDRNLAFQAAEAALRAAERDLNPALPAANFNNTAPNIGLLTAPNPDHANNQAYWAGYPWDVNNSRQLNAGTLAGLTLQPRYVIEWIDPTVNPALTPCPAPAVPPVPCDWYRITARGLGGSANAVVILQEFFTVQ